MRNLASVQVINAVEPIPGADAIEKARVLGWWVVVKNGEYSVGDRVVYCEIDSLLPERPEFEFLRKSSFKVAIEQDDFKRPAGFRVKTVKLRGQVSQGICFPLSILPVPVGVPSFVPFNHGIEEGTDVTELLGIVKYEQPPEGNGGGGCGRRNGTFPGFIPKTDETRVQNLYRVFPTYQGAEFVVTEKLDGTSYTAFLKDGAFGVCTRNNLIDHTGDDAFSQATLIYAVEKKLRQIQDLYGFQPAIQGELIGPKIQGNKYGLDECQLRVFSVYNIDTSAYMHPDAARTILTDVGFHTVPEICRIVLDHTGDDLVQMSIGKSVLNPKTEREGLVFRMTTGTGVAEWKHTSYKVINPNFLLKYDE